MGIDFICVKCECQGEGFASLAKEILYKGINKCINESNYLIKKLNKWNNQSHTYFLTVSYIKISE